MLKVQASYVTWTRSDVNGLFDYENLKSQRPDGNLIIENNGWIFRKKDALILQFCPFQKDNNQFQKILQVKKIANHFLLSSLKGWPLLKIIQNQSPKSHQLKKFQKIRMGKVLIQVLDLQFKQKAKISSYEQIILQLQNKQLFSVRQITPSYYQNDRKNKEATENKKAALCQSEYEENPSCRYCYSKTVTQENPFLVSCGCLGSARYIHQKCLLEWVLKRGSLKQTKKKNVIYGDQKMFKCELCHQFFYLPEFWRKIYLYQKAQFKNLEGQPFPEVLILYVKYQTYWLFFIDLSHSTTITLGRSLESDIALNQLSVSRNHAKLQIDSKQKIITLKDNNAKFGTLVEIDRTEVQNNECYQIGKTKISFKKYQKKSIIEKIGILCFAQQKLNKEIVKGPKIEQKEFQISKKQLVANQ